MTKFKTIIGIDCGVNTGFGVYDTVRKKLIIVKSMKIHEAMFLIFDEYNRPDVLVRVEDARLRTWFGKKDKGRAVLQGAGSVKRDAVIWEDFLSGLKLSFQMVHPKNNKTKVDAKTFKAITGWQEKTNEHARDAAMMCYGF